MHARWIWIPRLSLSPRKSSTLRPFPRGFFWIIHVISTDVCILHERRFRADVVIETRRTFSGTFSLQRFISLWKIIWSCAIGCKGGNVVTLFSTVRYFSSRIFAKYKLFRFLWNPVEGGGNGFWSENVTFYRNEISRNCCFLTYKLMKRKICKRWIENFHIFDPLLFPSLNEVVWINCRKLISERFWEVILTRIRVDRAITRRRRVWVCASKRQPPMRVSEEGGKRKAKYESRKNKMAAFLIPFHPTKSFSYIFLQ